MNVLTIKDATKVIHHEGVAERTILDGVDLTIKKGDFVTVLGGNGAGKSTLFNTVAGTLSLTSGSVELMGETITHWNEEKRARYIARVFQDPKMGTAPRMTVAENLLLALKRGQKRRLSLRKMAAYHQHFFELCQQVGNGLEQHLDAPAGTLSGGQRQALSLLMATVKRPELLLLDEHTAALDPKTAKQLMTLTDQRIKEEQLTCLMITHRMEDALRYGNRLIVLKKGRIYREFNAQEKEKLTLADLLLFFEEEEELAVL